MQRTEQSTSWLENYKLNLISGNADAIAKQFHVGFTYVINGEYNQGSSTFSKVDTWKFIFDKISYTDVTASNVREPAPGHIFFEEEIRLKIKETGEELIGKFVDEDVINSDTGQMVLIQRKADPKFFERLYSVLSPIKTGELKAQ
jgi:hypothetical protein